MKNDTKRSRLPLAAGLVSDSRVTVEQPDGNLVFIPASEPG